MTLQEDCDVIFRPQAVDKVPLIHSVPTRWKTSQFEATVTWRKDRCGIMNGLSSDRRAAHGLNGTRLFPATRDEPRPDDLARVGTGRQTDCRVPPDATGSGRSTRSIEVALYEAMRREGLSPIPQFYIQGFYVDFAFPDVGVAVEADGAVFHEGERHQRDRKRDWILRRAGWTVKRFHGTTIFHKAANCAYVIRREVEGRRAIVAAAAREAAIRRQAHRDALARPFRLIAGLLRRNKRG